MLNITNWKFFLEIAADAVAQAELNLTDRKEITRWVNAIAKGIAMLETDPTFIHWQADSKSLLILSDSNEIYSANGVCQCRAYTEGIAQRQKPYPCWHRALARLTRLYFEFQETPKSAAGVVVAPTAGSPQAEVFSIPQPAGLKRSPLAVAGHEDEVAIYLCGGVRPAKQKVNGFSL